MCFPVIGAPELLGNEAMESSCCSFSSRTWGFLAGEEDDHHEVVMLRGRKRAIASANPMLARSSIRQDELNALVVFVVFFFFFTLVTGPLEGP